MKPQTTWIYITFYIYITFIIESHKRQPKLIFVKYQSERPRKLKIKIRHRKKTSFVQSQHPDSTKSQYGLFEIQYLLGGGNDE